MDSPLCPDCLKEGKPMPQTYRLRGVGAKKLFKCGMCKDTFDASEFSPIDYEWRDKPEEFKSWMQSKGINVA